LSQVFREGENQGGGGATYKGRRGPRGYKRQTAAYKKREGAPLGYRTTGMGPPDVFRGG